MQTEPEQRLAEDLEDPGLRRCALAGCRRDGRRQERALLRDLEPGRAPVHQLLELGPLAQEARQHDEARPQREGDEEQHQHRGPGDPPGRELAAASSPPIGIRVKKGSTSAFCFSILISLSSCDRSRTRSDPGACSTSRTSAIDRRATIRPHTTTASPAIKLVAMCPARTPGRGAGPRRSPRRAPSRRRRASASSSAPHSGRACSNLHH